MNGAIFYSSKYGTTAQYASWIGEATGLPIFNIKNPNADPSQYDYLVLGSSVMFYKLTIRKWVKAKYSKIKGKPIFLFSVSGSGEGTKLNRWVANSLPKDFASKVKHFALLGRMNPKELGWGMRIVMRMGALLNPDPEASKEEREGFDYVDKNSIDPLVKSVLQFQSG